MSQPPVSFPTLQQQHPAAFAPTGYPFHPQQQQQAVLPQQVQQQHLQQQHQQQLSQAQQFFSPGFPQSQVRAPQQHVVPQHQPQGFPHGAGPVPVHAGGMNPMMMPAGFAQHNPMAQAGFQPQGFPHGVPTSMGQTSMPMTMSPHASTMPAQVQQQPVATTGPQNTLYSTPTRPAQNPAPAQMQAQTPTSAPPTAPAASPTQIARDRARVSVLLDINSALIQEVVNLQASGKAGLVANQPPSQQASPTQETNTAPSTPADTEAKAATPTTSTKPSMEYIECMRRLQGNLAFLATLADRSKKAGSQAPQYPMFMTPPPHLTSINDLYAKLNELFPNAPKQGVPQTLQTQQMQRPGQQQGQPQQPQHPQQPADGQTATPS